MTYAIADHERLRRVEAELLALRQAHPLDAQVNIFLSAALSEIDHADRYILWRVENPT
jgi:hypothetical protein